jgi:CP family cyanate transporter-like MFS transporter
VQRRFGLLAGLFLAGLALRPQIVGVGPLIPAIQDDLDISHAVAGLLGTIPVLCMGVFRAAGAEVDAAVRHAPRHRSLPCADRRLRRGAGGRAGRRRRHRPHVRRSASGSASRRR